MTRILSTDSGAAQVLTNPAAQDDGWVVVDAGPGSPPGTRPSVSNNALSDYI